MNGGALYVDNGDWLAIETVALNNGSSLEFENFVRIRGTWTVDASTFEIVSPDGGVQKEGVKVMHFMCPWRLPKGTPRVSGVCAK